jgi:hypothetical protein
MDVTLSNEMEARSLAGLGRRTEEFHSMLPAGARLGLDFGAKPRSISTIHLNLTYLGRLDTAVRHSIHTLQSACKSGLYK